MSTCKTLALITHQVMPHGDGQGRVNYEIARAALDEGYQIRIVAMRCAPELVTHPQVRFVELNYESWPSQLLRNAAFARASTRWLEAHRAEVDVVHACGFVVKGPVDVNSAHFVHGGWRDNPAYPFRWTGGMHSAYQRLYTSVNAHWEKQAYSATRKVVAVSNKIAEELAAIGVDRDRIIVIHNGVDTEQFRPGVGDRSQFGLPVEQRLFLFVGDIRTPRKGLDIVLEAMSLIENIHLAVAGAMEGSPFPERVSDLGLGSRVHFLGKVADVPTLMRAADAFVFPSRYEAMSLVILEAMASGLPILTARTAGGAEIIDKGGIVMDDPEDVGGVVHWMRKLANDDEFRRNMGQAARESIESHTWQGMADRYLGVYRSVLA